MLYIYNAAGHHEGVTEIAALIWRSTFVATVKLDIWGDMKRSGEGGKGSCELFLTKETLNCILSKDKITQWGYGGGGGWGMSHFCPRKRWTFFFMGLNWLSISSHKVGFAPTLVCPTPNWFICLFLQMFSNSGLPTLTHLIGLCAPFCTCFQIVDLP